MAATRHVQASIVEVLEPRTHENTQGPAKTCPVGGEAVRVGIHPSNLRERLPEDPVDRRARLTLCDHD